MKDALETLLDFAIGVAVAAISGLAIINPLINHFLMR